MYSKGGFRLSLDARIATRMDRWVVASVAFVVLGCVVYASGLQAWFVSDAWLFLGRSLAPLSDLALHAIPSGDTFYRPVVEAAFWVEVRLFDFNPLGYHVVALMCHLTTSAMLGGLAWRLTGDRVAGAAAALTMLLSIHAHEVVFDVADLHNAIGGLLLVGALFLFVLGRHVPAAIATLLLSMVDESALLVLPLLLLTRFVWPRPARETVRALAPTATVAAAYLAVRMATGGFGNEVQDRCTAIDCQVASMGQYLNRLLLRPEAVISKEAPLIIALVCVAIVVLLTQPWHWRTRRLAIMGAGWALGTSAFFGYALWPYLADRFIYIPSMGLALVTGTLISEGLRVASVSSTRAVSGWMGAVSGGIAVAVVAIWLAMGAVTLNYRGALWTQAGDRAASILRQIHTLHRDPPPGTIFSFRGVPAVYSPYIRPGSTGPFVFHNGLPAALRIIYDRADLTVVEGLPRQPPDIERHVIRLVIYTSGTVMADPDPF